MLGTGSAQHAVLLRGELLSPLLVGLVDLVCLRGHGPSFSSVAVDYFNNAARVDLLRAFPFPNELVLDIQLSDGSVRVATTIRPTSDRPVPVSFGWHPYLALPGTRESTLLRLPECEHRLLDDRGLPTGRTEPQPAESRPLGSRAFDDLFALGADRRLVLEADERAIAVDIDDGYRFAQ